MRSALREQENARLKCELAGDILQLSGRLRLRATGSSMLPTIWPGDVLAVERAQGNEIRKGDIVLFARHHRLVAHRVVSGERFREGTRTLTRGDAVMYPDAPVTGHELLGKVSQIVRNGKRIELGRAARLPARVMAALLQRSRTGVRIALGLHAVLQTSIERNTSHRVVSCQS